MLRILLLIVVLLSATSSWALDADDVGTYAVVHRDGHVTDFSFFASLTNEKWNIEQKGPDGAWTSVTCSNDCVLQESTSADMARFFPEKTLSELTPSCVHNSAFAFCSYTFKVKPDKKGYIMIALVTPHPTPVMLKKISEKR